MRRSFTILEVMVAIFLLTMVSGIVGIRMHKAIQKKKYHSELQRLRDRFTVSQKLAVAMQADWRGTLKKEGKRWIFETVCEEISNRKLPPLTFVEMDIVVNGKKIREITINFFASGHTLPDGVFIFSNDSEKTVWKTSDLFLKDEGQVLGPSPP